MMQYLEFMERAHQINDGFNLNQHETKILEVLARAQHVGQPLFVGDLISQKHIASAATLHGVVKGLAKKRLISLKPHKTDGRFRAVKLTKASLNRFIALQSVMNRAEIS